MNLEKDYNFSCHLYLLLLFLHILFLLSNLAPIISSAQVSDEIILALPKEPNTNGLIPNGSLIPINFLLVNKPKLYAPLISYKASIIFFTIVFSLLLEIK